MNARDQIKKLEDQANNLIAEVDALSRRRPDIKVRYITKLTARTKPAKTGYDKTVVQKITWLDNLIADLRDDVAALTAGPAPSAAKAATAKTTITAMTPSRAAAEYHELRDAKAKAAFRVKYARELGLK